MKCIWLLLVVPASSFAPVVVPLGSRPLKAEATEATEAPAPAPAPAPVVMSKALPFMVKPPLLDGTMAGDVGFDPLGLSQIEDVGIDLYWMREAEIK